VPNNRNQKPKEQTPKIKNKYMKKLVIIALAAVMLPTLLFAQGTINFTSAGANQYLVLSDTTRPAGMVASLWWSPDGSIAYTQIATSTPLTSGFLTIPTTGTTGVSTAPGASAWFYVAGTYTGGYTGQTTPWSQLTGGGGSPPGPANTMTGWTIPLTLTAIPEPSTIALAGLGVASLLIFRRRK